MTDKPRVLFVDDEADVTDGLRLSMRRSRFEILTANSAREGLDVLASRPIDVVVSDERMPEMSGSAFLTKVKRDFPGTQRIILTGQASLEATIAAINGAGIFHYLVKPCSVEDLTAALEDALTARDDSPDRAAERAELTRLEVDFDEALDRAWMAYQPIMRADGRTVFAYEALLRVDHPRMATPVDLIVAASRLERRWDLDRTVRALVAADLERVPPSAAVFINLLPESVSDPLLVDDQDQLADARERVVLEITERVPLETIADVDARLGSIRQAGFRLALDDLGAGYAGLTSLVTMKPDFVKFDLELVRDIDTSPERSSLLAALTVVGHDLGALMLAECIETEAEMAHLDRLGCDLFQGYLLGKPGTLPIDQR